MTLRTRLRRLEARKRRSVAYVFKWLNQTDEEALVEWRVKHPDVELPEDVHFLVWMAPEEGPTCTPTTSFATPDAATGPLLLDRIASKPSPWKPA